MIQIIVNEFIEKDKTGAVVEFLYASIHNFLKTIWLSMVSRWI